jgi:hypothetical protein
MFSAVLGLAGSAIGAISASNTAKAQMAQQQYQFDKQMELQQLQMGMALDAQRRQSEENAYQRQIEQMNRLIANQEREYNKQQSEEYKAQLMEERRAQIERQVLEDQEAAKVRQFQIEQLLQNQDLRADEREFALQQLAEAKSVAAGERADDMRRFLEDRAKAEMERDFVIGEYQDYKATADQERADELAVRNAILAQIGGLQNTLAGTQASLGPAPTIDALTQADIDAEIARRMDQNMSDVDRAATAVASVGEADLIRKGIDLSSTGQSKRAQIAGAIADKYQQARSAAYDDAMRYITGQSSALQGNASALMQLRQAILAETGGVAGAGLDQMQNLRALPSAAGAYQMATSVPSSIYNRNVASANDYRAPVSINSAVYDQINPGVGMAQYRVPSTAATMSGTQIGSSIFNPYNVSIPNPTTYMSNVGTIGNQLLSSATSSANQAATNAYNASSGFGKSMFDFLGTSPRTGTNDQGNPTYGPSYGQRLDDWFSGLFQN